MMRIYIYIHTHINFIFLHDCLRISFWLRQLAIFLTAWFFVKVTVVIVLNTFPFFSQAADWLLRPLHDYGGEKLQGKIYELANS